MLQLLQTIQVKILLFVCVSVATPPVSKPINEQQKLAPNWVNANTLKPGLKPGRPGWPAPGLEV